MKLDKIYFLDCHVAGRLYGQADAAWPLLAVGKQVTLRREPDNPKDTDAVAVDFNDGHTSYKLGYLPYRNNRIIALMLDMGWNDAFEASISRLDPSAPYDSQIGLIVKIVRCTYHDNTQEATDQSDTDKQNTAD